MKGHTLSAFVKLVVFAVVTVLATAVLAVTISNRTFGDTRTFKAEFSDVTGLLAGDDVRAAGVRVGTVKDIQVQQGRAVVTFALDKSVPLLESTQLQVRYLNLVGQRYISLVEQPGGQALQPQNETIPLQRTRPALDLTALFNGFQPLFKALTPKDVNSFALEIIKTLQGEGGTLADLAAKSASLTNTVADRDAVIGQVINNLLAVLGTVQHRDQGLNELINQLQRLVTGLATDRNTIAASLSHIDDLASNSALFLQQIRPYLPSTLDNLARVAGTLNTTKNCPGYVTKGQPKITAIPRFATNDCNGPNTLAEYLQRAPTKLIQIIRTATYGSFFNFYLCDLEMTTALGSDLSKIIPGYTGNPGTVTTGGAACGNAS